MYDELKQYAKMTPKQAFKYTFEKAISENNHIQRMVVAIQLPTGAIELIINHEHIVEKMEYYMNAYNDELELNATHKVRILSYMFA